MMTTSSGSLGAIHRPVKSRSALCWTSIVVALALGLGALVALGSRGLQAPGQASRRAGSVPALGAQPTAGAQGKLYVLSQRVQANGAAETMAGRLTILDQATLQTLREIDTGASVDAALSPDGARVYLAAVDAATDQSGKQDWLAALDASTGAAIWRTPLDNRVKYLLGQGPSALLPSLDGRRLYVYSYPAKRLDQPAPSSNWLQIVDTATGRVLPDTIDLSGCSSAAFTPARDGGLIYAACLGSNEVRIIDVRTRQVAQQRRLAGAPYIGGPPGGMAGAVVSPDERMIYIVTDNMQLAALHLPADVPSGTVALSGDLGRQTYRAIPAGLVALTRDGQQLLVATLPDRNAAGASGVRVFDINTLREVKTLSAPKPIVGATLATSPDGQFVYGIGSTTNGTARPVSNTILKLGLAGNQADQATVRAGEEILRVFTGP